MNEKLYLLLEYIRQNTRHSGKSPSFSEMVGYMNVSSKQTIEDWLTLLEKEGYIRRVGNPRKIEVTQKGESPSKIHKLKNDSGKPDKVTPLPSENYSNNFLNTSIAGGTNLKVNNVNLFIMKGGENEGTK